VEIHVCAEDAKSLLNSMWLNMTMHFGLRGRQEHTQMLWGDVELHITDSGNEYLEFNERSTKTWSSTSRTARPFAPRMFATGRLKMFVQLNTLY